MPKLRHLIDQARTLLDEASCRAGDAFLQTSTENGEWASVDTLEPRILFSASPMDLAASVITGTEGLDDSISQVASVAPLANGNEQSSLSSDNSVTGPSQSETASVELVFVDTSATNYQELLDDLLSGADDSRSFEVFVLDSTRDGVDQISEVLATRSDVESLHLVSHGNEGEVKLGSSWLDIHNLNAHAGQIANWGSSLGTGADLLIYGCDLASNSDGRALVDALATLCDCDVAASVDDTGHASFGADWDLEYTVGLVETEVAFSDELQESWYGKLAIITVDTFDDVVDAGDGLTSLREAILQVNAGSGGDTIELSAGTYTLSIAGDENDGEEGDMDIKESVTIIGAGPASTILDAGGLDRFFDTHGNGTVVDISNVTIQNGNVSGDAGAIYINDDTTVNLSNAIILNNTSGGQGGAFHVHGTINLDRVLLANNTAQEGGALYVHGNAGSTVVNSTLSGNTATNEGGAVWSDSPLTILNSTIAFNTSPDGSGIYSANADEVTITNTILYNPGSDNANKRLVSGGNNIDSDDSANLSGTGDQVNVDPLLETELSLNLGQIPTHAFLTGSPAVGGGNAAAAPSVDQRGFTRSGAVDIGAFQSTTVSGYDTSAENRGNTNAVAVDAQGNRFHVWSSDGIDGDGWGLLGQVFNSSGVSTTGAFLLNETTAGDQRYASVGAADDGTFVVTWTGVDSDQTGVYFRKFDADGLALSAETLVNSTEAATQSNASVAVNRATGDFIVAWEGNGPGDTEGIFYRRFDASGAAIDGTDQIAHTADGNSQTNPSIAVNESGQFVIAWQRSGGIYIRHFNADGSAAHNTERVENVFSFTHGTAVAINADGGSVVTYRENGSVLGGSGVWFQRYDHDGSKQDGYIQPSIEFTSDATDPSIAMDDDGNFIIVWEGTDNGDGDGNTVFARRYDANGNALESAFIVSSSSPTGNQQNASIALRDINNFTIMYSGDGPGESSAPRAVSFSSEPSAELWFTTNGAGDAGGETWLSSEIVQFGNSGDEYEISGNPTSGTFDKLAGFTAPADIRALHYVESSVRIGLDPNHFDLQRGDLVLVMDTGGTTLNAGDPDQFTADRKDIVVFRPTHTADYTEASGQWFMLLDNGVTEAATALNPHALTVVERDTTVGGTSLSAGTLLVSHGTHNPQDIDTLRITGTGANSAAVLEDFISGSTLGTSSQIQGLHLLQQATHFNGITLAAGTLLVEVNGTGSLGGVSHSTSDVLALTVTQTLQDTSPGTAATVQTLFDGDDIDLTDGTNESINGLTVVSSFFNSMEDTSNSVPLADAGGSYTIYEGQDLVLDASGSSDGDGDVLAYAWDLDNDGNYGETGEPTTDTATVDWATLTSFGIDRAGSYTIGVQVDDGNGGVTTTSATVLVAAKVAETHATINIDGAIDTVWDSTDAFAIENVTVGSIDNASDLQAGWRSLWDANNLYVLVEVSDDTLTNDSVDPFADDIVELFLDPNYSRDNTYDGVDDYQFAFRVSDGTIHLGPNSQTDVTGVTFTIDSSGSGYVAEIAIPWTLLGTTPTDGQLIGIDVHVGDDDDGGALDTRIEWAAGANTSFENPFSFGTAQLAAFSNTPPTAAISGPITIDEGDDLNLSASGSTDPDGTSLSYGWDLDNDGTFDDATGLAPSLTWDALPSAIQDDGTYTIAVQVTDADSGVTTATTTLTVNNVAPTITASGSSTVVAGTQYNLSIDASDPGADTVTEWWIDWGDGTIETFVGDPSSVSHTYTVAGLTNNIVIGVTDEDGTWKAFDAIVATENNTPLYRIDGNSTAVEAVFGDITSLDKGADLIIGADGLLYVTGLDSSNVQRFDLTSNTLVDTFVTSGSGGLDRATGIAFGPDGNLYVASYNTDEVLRYDATTGAFIDVFVQASEGGLGQPTGIAFGPDGNLLVSGESSGRIHRYDGQTGAYIDNFVESGNGLNEPELFTFGPDGNLYVADFGGDQILKYDGATGAFVEIFVTAGSGGLDGAVGLRFAPDGNLYVSSNLTDSILEFDGATGNYVADFLPTATNGLNGPRAFVFTPLKQVSVVAATDITANTDTYATDEDTPLAVGGNGVLGNDQVPQFATDGSLLDFSASDDTNGDLVWNSSNPIPGFDWDLSGGGVTYTTTPTTAHAAFSAAWSFDGTGGGEIASNIPALPGGPQDGAVSFELWFNPTDATGQEVLLDVGGQSPSGSALSLDDSLLKFTVDSGTVFTLQSDISALIASDEFIHVVGTIERDAISSSVYLYVNGTLVDSALNVNVGDWAGNNNAGLGTVQGSTASAETGNYEGEIAALRLYDFDLSADQVGNNYRSISDPDGQTTLTAINLDTTATRGTVTLNTDGSFDYDPNGQFDDLTAGASATDTFEYTATNGDTSNTSTVTISIAGSNDSPTLSSIEGATRPYVENSGSLIVTGTLVVGDVDDTMIDSATVQITSGYVNGEDTLALGAPGTITGSFDASTGTLTLSGQDTIAAYQAALRSVTFTNDSEAPTAGLRSFGFTVNDGDVPSNTVTRNFNVSSVNDAAVISNIEATSLSYSTGDGGVPITSTLTLSDVDGGTLQSATITLGTGYLNGEDTLTFVDIGAISGSFSAATGTLTLTGPDTLAAYQAAIRSIEYNNVAGLPTFGDRELEIVVNDGNPSVAASRTISVGNAAPTGVDDDYSLDQGTSIDSNPDWFDTDWTARQTLTFDNAAQGSDLDNFVVLVVLDSSNIDYSKTQDGGEDLRFVDTDGTILDYEIENWDESGTSHVWVRVPRIDSASATDSITMYYGNATATDGSNADGTWSAPYAVIAHLNDDFSDSSGNGNDGANAGSADVPGFIADGQNFDGNNDRIDITSNATIDDIFAGGGTISAWINPQSKGEGGYGRILDKSTGTTVNAGWALQFDDGAGLRLEYAFDGSRATFTTAPGTITFNTWQHVALTYDSSSSANTPTIFINGVEVAVTVERTPAGNAISDAGIDLSIGNHSGATSRSYDGAIDEVRIDNVVRTADWIAAQYASTTQAFVSFSGEELPSGVLDNDFDSEGDAITVSLVTGPANATAFNLNADGSFTYTPVNSFSGADTFTYRVNDGTADSTDVTVTLNVLPNATPTVTLTNTTTTLQENVDTSASIKVADINISDDAVGSNVLTLSGTHASLFEIVGGTELHLRAGTLVDRETMSSLDVTVEVDEPLIGGSPDDTALLSISISDVDEFDVGAINDADISANAVSEHAAIGASVGIRAEAVDQDATDAISYALDDDAGGLFAINATTGDIILAKAVDFEIADRHTVTVRAISSDLSFVTQSFSIAVIDENESPTISLSNPITTLAELTDTTGGLDVADITILDDALGTNELTLVGVDAAKFEIVGSKLQLRDGVDLDFETQDSWTVTIRLDDPSLPGSPEDSVDYTLSITNVNDAPILHGRDGTVRTFTEGDGWQQLAPTITISDQDNTHLVRASLQISSGYVVGEDELSFVGTTSLVVGWDSASGTLEISGRGTLEEYADAIQQVGFVNESDDPQEGIRRITLEVSDSLDTQQALVRGFDVNAVNDSPVANNDEFSVTSGDVLAIDFADGLLQNDFDPDSTDMETILQIQPSNGTLSLASDGSFVYTPDAGFVGTDSFRYRLNDGIDTGNVARVRIVVEPTVLSVIEPSPEPEVETDTTESETPSEEDETDDSLAPTDPGLALEEDEEEGAIFIPAEQATEAFSFGSDDDDDLAVIGYLSLSDNEALSLSSSHRKQFVLSDAEQAVRNLMASLDNEFAGRSFEASTFDCLCEQGIMWHDIEKFEENMEYEFSKERIRMGAAGVAASGLTIGFIGYIVRGGFLLTGLMVQVAQVPLMNSIDPMLVMQVVDTGNGESLQEIMRNEEAKIGNEVVV